MAVTASAFPSPSAVQVLVADDHDILRRALRSLLVAEGFQVVGEASDAPTAVAVAQRVRPDVIAMDLSMPGMVLPDTIQVLAAVAPVVVFTGLESGDPRIAGARKAGAKAIVSKQRSPEALVTELRTVLGAYASRAAALSRREREVLKCVARGLTNAQIAADLGIGAGTVRTHLRVAMSKLGAHTRTEAVMRLGVIALEPPD
jgi:DNA-binding NarL/FixJ family response regulator